MASTNRPGAASTSAVGGVDGRFSPSTEPNALSGSPSIARCRAVASVSLTAAPQGLLCLMTTAAGSENWRTIASALSRSSRLLYESSLPCSCRAATTLAPWLSDFAVEGRLLVRILAVAQHHLAGQADRDRARKRPLGGGAGEEVGDRPIVAGGLGKRLAGQAAAQLERRAAVGRNLIENLGILGRVGGDRGEGVVLGRRSDQRRPANVDLLDGLFPRNALPRHGGLERIEVHHDQLEREDAVLGQRLHVVGIVVAAEDSAVDLRMEGFEPAIHHLGEAGVLGDVADGDALALQVFSGSAGAENLHAGGDKPAGEIGKPQLVAHADQGTLNARRIHGNVSRE